MTAISSRMVPWTFVLDEPVRVLVVDDDPILREFASVYLATPCATIDTACDVPTARRQLQDNDYDVVLLDIEMPQIDGFTLLEEIRSNQKLKHLPVIMLTGHDDIISIDRAYQIGANSFATKPVNWRQLSYQIRYVVRTSGRHAEHKPAHAGATTAANTENAVRDFLQSVIHRAGTLRNKLQGHDRERLSALLQNLSVLADRAVAECGPQALNSPPGGAAHATAADMSHAAMGSAA